VVPFHKNTAGPALWGRPPYLMKEKIKEIVVPREDAVFWLDGNGFWHNREEKFTHRKIINYFHSSIRKDKKGYYLFQVHPGYREKVYFPYEDTALFVFEVVRDDRAGPGEDSGPDRGEGRPVFYQGRRARTQDKGNQISATLACFTRFRSNCSIFRDNAMPFRQSHHKNPSAPFY